ncbi:hypothetical protein EDC96DRAFT_510630 [Choanephora cucurbitarum]|nr:hypothetical protein EDC96DRAFT_510630 [Choanephora cucurbitarum]
MPDSLPWSEDKPLSLSQLLKHSMRSVDALASNNSLLDKMSIHLNGLLRQDDEPRVDKAVQVFDNMFLQATKAMSTDSDKQVVNLLRRQVSSFIGVTLGVKPFLESREYQEVEESDDEDENEDEEQENKQKPKKLSWNKASEGEASSYLGGSSSWAEKKAQYEENNQDIYAPEHAEHDRLRRELQEEGYGLSGQHGEHNSDQEEDEGSEEYDSDDYEEVVERVEIKSRDIGGASEFTEVRRRRKKKTKQYIQTNFSYSHSTDVNPYDGGCGKPYYKQSNQHRKRFEPVEFRPRYLEHLPSGTFCIPVFFPSEDSYSLFHSALSTAKHTLHVCVFSMTDNDTARVLSDAKRRGVDVKVITDNDQMDPKKGADIYELNEKHNIPFKCDDSEQFMHNKFAVIDRKMVITGSFNWSAGARYKNRENIIITNIPSVVQQYDEEFQKLWNYF